MIKNELIKSNVRVKKNGEVFTPRKIVRRMTNFPELHDDIRNVRRTVLEPSAGEGAFLLPILQTKLNTALRISRDTFHYNRYSLIALSSLYGIELLEDNVTMLVMKFQSLFRNMYARGIQSFHGNINKSVLKSAKIIIHANVVQGNTLTGLNGNSDPIIMSEWMPVSKFKVKRKNFHFRLQHNQQLTLTSNKFYKNLFPNYIPVDIVNVYKELFE